ncbi:MAG: UPF0158 family protein [Pyrinomonadaceae bacterium]
MPKVLYSELEDAFNFSGSEHQYWLDKQTGEVIAFDEETARQLAAGDDLANAPEWQRGMIEGARRVLQAYGELPGIEADEPGDSDRYVQIPGIESSEAYQDMTDFAETVADSQLRELLAVALDGRGAFRRFKDVLVGCLAEQERWFEFRDQRLRERIKDWAREEGVEIDFDRGDASKMSPDE